MTHRRLHVRWLGMGLLALTAVAVVLFVGPMDTRHAEAQQVPCVAVAGDPGVTWDCTFDKPPAAAATHLDATFKFTGGQITDAVVTVDPAACPNPNPAVANGKINLVGLPLPNRIKVNWQDKCIPFGAANPVVTVQLTLSAPKTGIAVAEGWTWSNKPVGGIAELAEAAGTPLETAGSSGSNTGLIAGIVAAIAAGTVAFGGAAWYARRRWIG